MRLKQLLGIVLLASVSAMAADTVSQSGDVLVKNQTALLHKNRERRRVLARFLSPSGGDGVKHRDQRQRPDDGQDHEADSPRPRCRGHPEFSPPGTCARNSGQQRRRENRYAWGATRKERPALWWTWRKCAISRLPRKETSWLWHARSSTSKPAPLPAMKEAVVTRRRRAANCCAGTCCASRHNRRKDSGEGRGSHALQV